MTQQDDTCSAGGATPWLRMGNTARTVKEVPAGALLMSAFLAHYNVSQLCA